MENKIGVSVIIPVFNGEKTIKDTLEHVIHQTFTSYEIVLVDDGSTDTSGKICESYASIYDNIRVLHKNNGGVSSARNEGIKAAKGEWITFVDADDTVMPNYLEALYDRVYSDKTEFGIGGCQTTRDGITEHSFIPPNQIFIGIYDFKNFLNQHLNNPLIKVNLSKIFNRKLLISQNVRFDTKLKVAEDSLFILNYLTIIHSVSMIPSIIYNYQNPPDLSIKYPLTLDEVVYKCSKAESCLKILETIYKCDISERNKRNWCGSMAYIPYLDFVNSEVHDSIIDILNVHGLSEDYLTDDNCNLYLRSLKVLSDVNSNKQTLRIAKDTILNINQNQKYSLTSIHPKVYHLIDKVVRMKSRPLLNLVIAFIKYYKRIRLCQLY